MNATAKATLALGAIFLLALAAVLYSQNQTQRVVALLEYSISAPIGGIESSTPISEFDVQAETFLAEFDQLLESIHTQRGTPGTQIRTKAIPNTNLIQVSLNAKGTEPLTDQLNAIIDQALEQRKDNSQAFFNQEIQRIYDQRDALEAQRFHTHQQHIENQTQQLQTQIATLEGELAQLKPTTPSAPAARPPATAEQTNNAAFLTYSHDNTLRKLAQEQARYQAQLDSLSASSPLRPSLISEIDRTQRKMAEVNALKAKILQNQPKATPQKPTSTRPENEADKASRARRAAIQRQLVQLRRQLKQIDTELGPPSEAHLQAIEELEIELENVVRTASSAIQVRWFKRPALDESAR